MMTLERFFKNPFLDREISLTELQSFAEDHIAKLAAGNATGKYDSLLADSAAAYTDYFGELTNLSLRSAVQKAATQTMRRRWKEFVDYMTGPGEARVRDRAGKPSAVYTEFYPQGNSGYHLARIADIQTLAGRVKSSAADHVELLGADFKTTVDGLAAAFLSGRNAQMEQKGGRADLRGSRDAAKVALQDQLFENLLALASEWKNPAKCALFFNQSLLEDPVRPSPPPAP